MKQGMKTNKAAGILALLAAQVITAQLCFAGDFVMAPQPAEPTLTEKLSTARNQACQWIQMQELTTTGAEDFKALCGAQGTSTDESKFSFPRFKNGTELIQNIRNLENGISEKDRTTSDTQTAIQLSKVYNDLDEVLGYVIATSSNISVDRSQVDAVNQVFSTSYSE